MVKKGWRRERMRQVFLLLAKSQEACSSQSKYCFQVFSSRLFVHLSNLMAKEKTRNRKCAENCGSIGFQASLPSNRHGFQSFSHILFLTECQSAVCPQHTAYYLLGPIIIGPNYGAEAPLTAAKLGPMRIG